MILAFIFGVLLAIIPPQPVQPALNGSYCAAAMPDIQAAIRYAEEHAEQDPAGAMKRLRDATKEIIHVCPDIK